MNESIVLEAKGLYKVFGRRPQEAVKKLAAGQSREELSKMGTAAVIDASFQVRRGEIFVVMGLSGSGKSTLIRMLNGLLPATAGQVSVSGTDLVGISDKALRKLRQQKISMVFQHFALMPHRTVLENAAYALEVQGIDRAEREARALKVLKLVGLEGWEQKYPGQLSGGMKQRVGLARALAAETDILLMDEAFSALDPLIRREMQEQLITLQRELGKTIIFITHDLNEAMLLGDRIAMMHDGRIVQIGSPDEILKQPTNDYVEQFVQDVDRTRVLTAGVVMDSTPDHVTAASLPGATTVSEDAPLADILGLAADSRRPLAVVDGDDHVIGSVGQETLLSALSNSAPAAESAAVTKAPGGDATDRTAHNSAEGIQ
ncbi:glycine betaine/L-proline ABC transporter ATP-binding protein [Arthrobacter sp. H5]|uniref:quaternary amine ABC transporter ATP-binding protein n=1 Tax=Arthrobacter sp. H5 TaxID=1267973 RepID=UPI0004AC9640|nr:glycine betaine/L-proline ABC transporter ATP-binding protein [Arthrobacter sp. H5]